MQLRDALASKGRFGDTELAHVNPKEKMMLEAMGGSGTINPNTGLREYFSLGDIGGLLSGAAALGGTIYGAVKQGDAVDAQNRAVTQNNAISQEQIELARRALDAQLADRTDAYGNTVQYDEENGLFQTIVDPQVRQVLDAQIAEELRQLTEDASRNRRGAERREVAALPAQEQLLTEIGKYSNPDQYTPEGIRGLLETQSLGGVDRAFRDVTDAASRTIARTGPDAFGRTYDKIAQSRADANAKAMADAAVRSLGLSEDLNQAGDNRIGNRLATLSPLASGETIRSVSSNQGGTLSNALAGQQQNVGNAALGASSALGGAGMGAQSINNPGVDIAAIGSGIGGLLQNLTNLGVSNPFDKNRTASGNTTSGPTTGGTKSGGYFRANGGY